MTRESLGWFVAGIVAVLVCTLGAMQREGQVGRYQLLEGRFVIVSGGKDTTEYPAVWRIDTVTGNVSMYRSFVGGPTPGSGWWDVGDLPR